MGGNLLVTTLQGLSAGVPIVDNTGAPTPAFLVFMQQITSGLANSSGASMPAPSPVSLYYDYTGALNPSSQLPKYVGVQRILDGTDVSTRTRWFLSTLSGTITATIDQVGLVTITALGSNSELQVKSVRDGVTLTCNVSVSKVVGTPPSAGSGGGAAASTSSFSDISSSAYSVIAGPLSVTVGSSGNVSLNAPLDVTTSETLPTGTFPVFGKWQWYNGTTYVDVAAEVQSSPSCQVIFMSKGNYSVSDGSLTVNTAKTGLTVGATALFKLLARNGSGTRDMSFIGTASAIP